MGLYNQKGLKMTKFIITVLFLSAFTTLCLASPSYSSWNIEIRAKGNEDSDCMHPSNHMERNCDWTADECSGELGSYDIGFCIGRGEKVCCYTAWERVATTIKYNPSTNETSTTTAASEPLYI